MSDVRPLVGVSVTPLVICDASSHEVDRGFVSRELGGHWGCANGRSNNRGWVNLSGEGRDNQVGDGEAFLLLF